MTEKTFLAGDGIPFVYEDMGPEAGDPVVLCHGLGAAGIQFRADADYFAGKGWRVLVPDLRGHGRSGAPDSMRDEDFSIERMARDLIEMLDHAGVGPVHWIGNSLGGILALAILGLEPERIRSLATYGTAYTLGLPSFVPHLVPLIYGALGPRLAAELTARSTTSNVEAQRLIASVLRDFSPKAGKAVGANVRSYDLIANAQGYEGPILLMRGGLDHAVNRALPTTIEAMAEHPDFRVKHLPKGGHVANLDVPEEFRATLEEFWREVEAKEQSPARGRTQ